MNKAFFTVAGAIMLACMLSACADRETHSTTTTTESTTTHVAPAATVETTM